MNRNALVGAGLAALVLAALAVGIATFVSGQGIDQSAEELRTEVAKETKETVDELASKQNGGPHLLGQAQGFDARRYLDLEK